MKEDLQKQLIRDLVQESAESLDEFDRLLLRLESDTYDRETLHTIFRVIHTIKGSSGCLGLAVITKVAHAGENLLALLRDGKVAVSQPIVDTLLACGDALRDLLQSAAVTGDETTARDLVALIAALERLGRTDPEPCDEGFGLFEDAGVAESPQEASLHDTSGNAPTAAAAVAGPDSSQAGAAVADTAIRVDVSQLDRLMNLVGELVLARNQILQHASGASGSALTAAAQRLNIITTELQESVMKTRMQPIGNVWNKLPRLVRDLSHDLGKEVALRMEGTQTELDRTILEAIKDPLTHILRNSVDHGIETPDERSWAGKPQCGEIHLRAYHEGGQVNIEIADDGRGIDCGKLLRRSIEKGVITSAQATRLSETEVLRLVFHPGLSTADQVSNVSGRGVGMDVVKTNIERIGGSVELKSTVGQGTAIRIKIPLTLAIIPALVVSCAGSRYAIPQANLVELVRIQETDTARAIEHVDSFPVYRLRGNLLPLVYLDEVLEVRSRGDVRKGSVFLVVVQAETRQFGLVVDSISDTEEIVVKPLGQELKGLDVYAGATVMGDGRVALILDIFGLARHAHLAKEHDGIEQSAATDETAYARMHNVQSFVLCHAGGRRLAVRMDSVARLEEFPAADVEAACGFQVVQYRGDILPLLPVSRILWGRSPEATGNIVCTVVYRAGEKTFGLVVDRIADIVEQEATVQLCMNRPGILGTSVIDGRVTDVLDVSKVIELAAEPDFQAVV